MASKEGGGSGPSSNPRDDESTRIFASGLLHLLQPIVVDCDAHMQSVFKSQNELSEQIDSLSRELERFVSVSQSPSPSLLAPVNSLARAKQRLITINTTLNNIKERLDRMEKIASSDASTTTAIIPEVISSLFGKMRAPANTVVKQDSKTEVTSATQQPPTDTANQSQVTPTTQQPNT